MVRCRLSASRHDEWYKVLREMGFTDPGGDDKIRPSSSQISGGAMTHNRALNLQTACRSPQAHRNVTTMQFVCVNVLPVGEHPARLLEAIANKGDRRSAVLHRTMSTISRTRSFLAS